ncbi:hypothetical protein BDV18DRAFT_163008 [Aspergillus unguis]
MSSMHMSTTTRYANVALIAPKPTHQVRFVSTEEASTPSSSADSCESSTEYIPPRRGSPWLKYRARVAFDDECTIIPRRESDKDSYGGHAIANVPPRWGSPKPRRHVSFDDECTVIPRPESDEDSYDGPVDYLPPRGGSPWLKHLAGVSFDDECTTIPRPESDQDSYDGPILDVPPRTGSPWPKPQRRVAFDDECTVIPRPESDEDSYDGPVDYLPPRSGSHWLGLKLGPLAHVSFKDERTIIPRPESDEDSYDGPIADVPPRSGTPCPTKDIMKVLPRSAVADIPPRPKSPYMFVKRVQVHEAELNPGIGVQPGQAEIVEEKEKEKEKEKEMWSQRTIYSSSGQPLDRSPTLTPEVMAKFGRKRKRRLRRAVRKVLGLLKF